MEDLSKNPEVREALQRRDIDDLRLAIQEGFRGVHERQDTTNGKVLKNTSDITALQIWNEKRTIENKYNKLIWYLFTVALTTIVALGSYIIYHTQ